MPHIMYTWSSKKKMSKSQKAFTTFTNYVIKHNLCHATKDLLHDCKTLAIHQGYYTLVFKNCQFLSTFFCTLAMFLERHIRSLILIIYTTTHKWAWESSFKTKCKNNTNMLVRLLTTAFTMIRKNQFVCAEKKWKREKKSRV